MGLVRVLVPSPDSAAAEERGWYAEAFDLASRDFKRVVTKACTDRSRDHPAVAQRMRERDLDFYSATMAVIAAPAIRAGRVEVGSLRTCARTSPRSLTVTTCRSAMRFTSSCAVRRRRTPASTGPIASTTTTSCESYADKAHRLIDTYGYGF